MRFGGNIAQNFSNAQKSGDKNLQRDMLLDEIAQLIADYPVIVYGALKTSGAKISADASKKQLIDATVNALQTNALFRTELPKLIVASKSGALRKAINEVGRDGYSNAGGIKDWFTSVVSKVQGTFNTLSKKGDKPSSTSATSSGGGGGGAFWGGLVGVIGGVTESVFDWKASKSEADAEAERTKQSLYAKLLGGSGKTKWMPIIIVGGVLILGSIVVIMTLKVRSKKWTEEIIDVGYYRILKVQRK